MQYLTDAEKEHAMANFMKISDAVGGQAALARELGVSRVTITDIKKSGTIPPHRAIGYGDQRGLLDIAKSKGLDVKLNDLRPDIWRKWHSYEEPFFS